MILDHISFLKTTFYYWFQRLHYQEGGQPQAWSQKCNCIEARGTTSVKEAAHQRTRQHCCQVSLTSGVCSVICHFTSCVNMVKSTLHLWSPCSSLSHWLCSSAGSRQRWSLTGNSAASWAPWGSFADSGIWSVPTQAQELSLGLSCCRLWLPTPPDQIAHWRELGRCLKWAFAVRPRWEPEPHSLGSTAPSPIRQEGLARTPRSCAPEQVLSGGLGGQSWLSWRQSQWL